MSIFNRNKKIKEKRGVKILNAAAFEECLTSGYIPLDQNPEIVAGCRKIAEMIASMTIYLMANTAKGDVRVKNELSRRIDVAPYPNMTRFQWMTAICMNLLLYGDGNSVVLPHIRSGYLDALEPIPADRVSFKSVLNTSEYKVYINNVAFDPDEVLHFRINADKKYLWLGRGFRVTLKTIIDTLNQAQATAKGFMSSKWKPSVIVKVDALTDEFSSPEGRKRLLKDYIETSEVGEPWIIPAEQFSVDQIRPLSLTDLAVDAMINLDKRTVAAVLGVPAFILGVGEYKADEWDSFISNTIRPIAQSIEQELTAKLILSESMYLMFNVAKLYSYDLQKIANVYSGLYDKGIVTGNEVRDRLGMQPLNGLDDLIVLENYIPITQVGNQKKLNGGS